MRNLQLSQREHVEKIIGLEKAERSITYAYGLIITVSVILLFGLTMLYSTSYGTSGSHYFYRQLIWAGAGMMVSSMVFAVGYRRLAQWSVLLIVFSCLLLIVAALFFPEIKGARRWIIIPHIGSIQPSEIAKIAVVLYLSKYCADNMRYINDIFSKRGPFPGAAVAGIVLLLIFMGKDLGTTVLLGFTAMLIFMAGGLRLRYILPPLAVAIPAVVMVIKKYDRMRWARLTSFLDPELYQKSEGYQLWNSFLALGSGSWLGIGFMESRIKAKYLPEAHTDFILSIVGEELGYISILLVIAAYLVFGFFALKISINSRSKQGMLLGFGVTCLLLLQAMVNIGVISGGLPTKGMPAPFISYGGSNLLMSMCCVALLVNIAFDTAFNNFNDDLLDSVKKRFKYFRRAKS